VFSARSSSYQALIEKVENPDLKTVVCCLKFPTEAFLPTLADPFAYIYKKDIIEKDPHWYEKKLMGSGPFKFVSYDAGQSIKGERNPDYYHQGKPYLDAFEAVFAPKQATRIDAMRSDRGAIDFRGLPPSAPELRDGHRSARPEGGVVEPDRPYRSYVKGWNISPSHFLNQDLATIWLDK
jgi:peptide/nickel transport system substrate-binding protein